MGSLIFGEQMFHFVPSRRDSGPTSFSLSLSSFSHILRVSLLDGTALAQIDSFPKLYRTASYLNILLLIDKYDNFGTSDRWNERKGLCV